jgi:radical SAM protein with 4Fe4S-binding SPASM domain
MCVAESRRLRLRTIFNTYSEISRRRDILNLALNDDEFLELGRATPSLAKMRFSYKPCFGGSVTYAIDPNGDLLACDHVTTSLGNVLKDPIAPLWAATEAREFSRQVYDTPDGCRSCPDELRQYCTYCPASTLNAGIPHAEWVAHFCALAKRKRLMHFEAFRTGRS